MTNHLPSAASSANRGVARDTLLLQDSCRNKIIRQLKRERIGSKYIHKDNPEKVLSTKEWRALPKEERDNYTKSETAKDVVERVSYAKA